MKTSSMTTHDVERTDQVMVVKHPNSVSIGISNPTGLSVWTDWQPCDEHITKLSELLSWLQIMQGKPQDEEA
jgi:hypothetical protein